MDLKRVNIKNLTDFCMYSYYLLGKWFWRNARNSPKTNKLLPLEIACPKCRPSELSQYIWNMNSNHWGCIWPDLDHRF